MNKEKTAFSLSTGSLFVPVKPPSFTFSQIQPTFDPSRVPPEKHPNCASQIVKALTSRIIPTFNKCNPRFQYEPASNPKRCLTAPAEGVYNNGHDNINNEYILYVNDIIKSPENEEYLILELLGKGTFGQVIRCIRKSQKDQFAVKVIKNKPAYTNQALTEVKIYKKLKEEAISNEDHIVRLFDYFVFRNHICLIFELLHISLYDLLRLSNFSGFSLKFIGRLTEQIIDSMTCLERNKIIHCDLKPENVLFADEESDSIKVIDLGSSCFLHNTVYTYIQSRFYRAPEVILGSKYTNKIDSWSLGCMVAEFYLGLPLFPGNSEYDQLKRIIDILGVFEDEVIENGRFKNKFFKRENDTYTFKTVEEFEQEQNTKLQPHKKYFLLKKLEDLEMYYNKSKQREKQPQEKQRFDMFVHFLKGLLQINPAKRWTASQAKFHPFLAGTPFEPNWEPLPHHEAMEESRKLIVKSEENKPADSNPFHKATPELFNAESYRPAITEKKEEVSNQTVYLINSQATSSTKPKSKLNAKAANFSTGFQVPALNLDPQATGFNAKQKGSQSEPNSARNSFRKQGKDANEVQFSYQEEKEEYVEGQEEQNKDQQNTGQGVQGGQKGFKQQQQQQYQGKGGYRDANNASHNEQFYPSGQHGNYQQGGYQPRQRSNSDQGSSENIFFQQNKGKQHQQQQQYQQYPPQQFQQYPPQQFQQYPPQQFQQYPPQQFQQYQQFPPQQYQQYQQFQQHPQQYQQQYQGNNQFQNNTYNPQYNQFQGGMGQHNQGYANAGNQPKHGKKWSGSHGKGGSGYKNQHGNNNSSQYDEKEELKEK